MSTTDFNIDGQNYTVEYELGEGISIVSVTNDETGREVPMVDGGLWDIYGDAMYRQIEEEIAESMAPDYEIEPATNGEGDKSENV